MPTSQSWHNRARLLRHGCDIVLDHKNSLDYSSKLQSCNDLEIQGTIFHGTPQWHSPDRLPAYSIQKEGKKKRLYLFQSFRGSKYPCLGAIHGAWPILSLFLPATGALTFWSLVPLRICLTITSTLRSVTIMPISWATCTFNLFHFACVQALLCPTEISHLALSPRSATPSATTKSFL